MSLEIEEKIFEPARRKGQQDRTPNNSLSNFTLSQAHLKLGYLSTNHKVATCTKCDREFPLTSFSSSCEGDSRNSFSEYCCPVCGGQLVFEG